jgi:predicted acyltransferase
VDTPTAEALHDQLEHVAWDGLRFYDLIFPLFLFLVGCVLPFSLEKYRGQQSLVYGRIVRRTLLLFGLGLVCNGLFQMNWENLRVAGVLQRIAICYLLASLVYLQWRWPGQAIAVAVILIGYWMVMTWVGAPGGRAGDLSPEGNLSGYLDRHFLPGKIMKEYYGHGDNEGLLSTIPAVATALTGALAGQWLLSSHRPWRKAAGLAVAGLACLGLGYAWSWVFPIIKILWTSSYVLVAAGWSLLMLAVFYTLIDVLKWRRWSFFWVVIGMNAITIYVVPRFVDFNKMSQFFLGGVAKMSGAWGPVVLIAGALAAQWLFLYYLYRQKLFLRV